MANRPLGVAILGGLHLFGAIFSLIALVMSIPFLIVVLFENPEIAGVSALSFVWSGIIMAINFAVAGALFAGRPWGRMFILFVATAGIIFDVISIIGGNLASIIPLIFNVIVIGYLQKPHVIKYFYGQDYN